MPSSRDSRTWDRFSGRPTYEVEPLRGAPSAIADALRKCHAGAKHVQTAAQASDEKWETALAEIARFVHGFEHALDEYLPGLRDAGLKRQHDHFKMIKDQLRSVLDAAGIVILDLGGSDYRHVSELIVVDAWEHLEHLGEEVVLRVKEPAILRGERILRLGRVAMGAPLSAAPDPQQQQGNSDGETTQE